MPIKINASPTVRLSDAEIAAWREIPAAVISDDLDRTGTMDAAMKPRVPGKRFPGQALTMQTMVGDNATLNYGLSVAWPGCVVVVDARGHTGTAICGILTVAAEVKGVAELVGRGGRS